MTRDREVNVYVPVVGGPGVGGYGSILAALGLAALFAVLVMTVVEVAEPTPHFTPVPAGQCAPFCSVYNPTSTSVAAGGEQR